MQYVASKLLRSVPRAAFVNDPSRGMTLQKTVNDMPSAMLMLEKLPLVFSVTRRTMTITVKAAEFPKLLWPVSSPAQSKMKTQDDRFAMSSQGSNKVLRPR